MKQLSEFKKLLQEISRKLDNISELLQRLVDAQEAEDDGGIDTIFLDGRTGTLNWTGQDD